MTSPASQTETSYGFLTILEDSSGGLLGGLLVVNRRGRPLEFHCTAPMVTSRAEEILFGPTLRPHLYCERIGAALLAKVTSKLDLLAVNQLDAWPIADETAVPVVLVDPRPMADSAEQATTSSGQSQACLDRLDPAKRSDVQRLLDDLSRYVDPAEPFERITEAIREAGLLEPPAPEASGLDEVAHDAAA